MPNQSTVGAMADQQGLAHNKSVRGMADNRQTVASSSPHIPHQRAMQNKPKHYIVVLRNVLVEYVVSS